MEFLSNFSLKETLAAFMVLFAIIDILGSVPIILDVKAKAGKIGPMKAALVAFLIFLMFFFAGEPLLALFGVDISSFAIAGSLVILLLGLEMVMGIELFKHDTPGGGTIVPIAFPLIAGAGSITTLLSLKAEYAALNILIALILNMIVVFLVLRMTSFVERILGPAGVHILRKIFGVILLAIAVKLFLTNTGIVIPTPSN
ncbi:MAG: MarC family protein [Bacteroidales bacterium]|nr:MarC family protein [Bacteroidales bacterium]